MANESSLEKFLECFARTGVKTPWIAMPQILVRNVDKTTVDALKLRASRHRTSLQAEVKGILEQASIPVLATATAAAKRIQARLRRRGAAFTDSGLSQAEDRRR